MCAVSTSVKTFSVCALHATGDQDHMIRCWPRRQRLFNSMTAMLRCKRASGVCVLNVQRQLVGRGYQSSITSVFCSRVLKGWHGLPCPAV